MAVILKDQDGLKQEFSAAQLADMSLETGVKIPGAVDPNDSVKRYMQVGLLLAPLFKKTNIVEVDSFRVERIVRAEYNAEKRHEFEAKSYVFSLLHGR